MDRFVSNYTLRLDAKGRVSIPAPFRAVLARDGFEGLYCYPTLDRPALDAGGNALLKEIETLIARFPPYSEEREQFSAALYGTSEVLKIDGEGRAVLTEGLKSHAGIKDEISFAGLGHKFQILGAWTLPRGTRGGHREGSRAQEAAGLPGNGGRSARSTGMTAGSDSAPAVAGGLARHIPVLGRPAVEFLDVRAGRVYVDATFGAGGYTREILATANCSVIGIDRDQSAIARGADLVQAASGRLILVEDRFSNLQAVVESRGQDAVDGVVFDLGVSSMQLDEAERGFSFRHDGPLDMRMGGDGPSAAEIVAAASERDLAAIVATLGEERHARAVARAVVAARRDAPIRTTGALAAIVARVVHARPGAIHPATRTFQALRIFVNEELAELICGLTAAEQVLRPGGRLVVVTFHSLEDRIAKSFLVDRSRRAGSSRHVPEIMQAAATFRVLTKRPIVPDAAEVGANPRARSAKLRAAERTDAAVAARRSAGLLPRLPSPADILARQGSGRPR